MSSFVAFGGSGVIFCARFAARGLAPKAIVGAAMRKLLHLAYGVLASAHPFDADLALAHRARQGA